MRISDWSSDVCSSDLVTLWDEYIGRFEASKAVEVRPRVSGAITAIHFTDGQVVRKGQPLFTIDPRPYRAALADARASAASARSDRALAQLELDPPRRPPSLRTL